jgi:hypothetical protein
VNASTVSETRDYATKKGVALFTKDIEDVERIRDHFGLDSFSQALRRAIKLAITKVDEDQKAAA